MTNPNIQVAINALFRPLTSRSIMVENAMDPPEAVSRKINEPNNPQTKVTHPIVGSCITESKVSDAVEKNSVGDRIINPKRHPPKSDSNVFLLQMANPTTKAVGNKLMRP